jgi:hypothetical protein
MMKFSRRRLILEIIGWVCSLGAIIIAIYGLSRPK